MGSGISKASYNITVKTGDQKGSGTDVNVYIILHGKGFQTNECKLDNFFKNDFERGEIDKFSIDSEVNISEVQRIELRRDNCGLYSNWYLDWIEVTNKKNSITFIFPAMKWIKANGRYFFNHHTCLPQDDLFLETRKLELQAIQAEYQLQVKIHGLPAQVKKLPEDEKFSFHYEVNFALEGIKLKGESFKLMMTNKNEWEDVEDVKTVYTKAFGVPQSSQYFNDDAQFGRQRLSSLNSLLIELCTTIPQTFGVTEDMIKPFLEGKTMKQAMDDKKLFIVDLAILEDCPTKSEDLVMTCPLILFYFNDSKHLMPIAIQLFQQKGPRNPVFLPSDPKYTWMLAKMWYSLADSTYHQSLTHLNYTHLMMEGISVATKRNLALQHPILKLLDPHFLYLMAINSLALVALINPDGIIDKNSNAGIKGHFHIMRKSMSFWKLDLHGTLPEDLKNRGVFDQSVLTGAYHMRDDALLLYDAIKTYVEKYVLLYYSTDSSLTADYELQSWGAELVKSRDDGGVGILGVPGNGNFKTTNQLVLTLTAIIYTCSAGHAAANFQQYDEYGAPFNYPYYLSGVPPKDKSPVTIATILKTIPNRDVLLQMMIVTKVLSEKATKSLGDFEKQFIVDPKAVKVVEEFRQTLRQVGKTIESRNKKREYPYDWLLPKAIPNAISI
ncbi:allene oxide synthase-lipoxygenase protein-like isoform X2 [Mytilus californianus]|uniref:allene oxide synthase-lipoxygenase protein-like isoform X2 n=1 Tax=Mytilus californianus TaxID=6549 RepID=UPI0022477D99|nr:allene oxide synthase-lipoxygenase protein-like isoform X2 [Mytilus californianus]XP_052089711.1 allene oxide synthase-lipoxygenase protein-like isoform X2 [Mytilus californianus]